MFKFKKIKKNIDREFKQAELNHKKFAHFNKDQIQKEMEEMLKHEKEFESDWDFIQKK